MDLVSRFTQLPYPGGITSQFLLLLLFLNQLCIQHCSATKHAYRDVEHCIQSLKQEENLLKEQNIQLEADYATLSADYTEVKDLYLKEAQHTDKLSETLQEYKQKISELGTKVQEETSARRVCERNATSQNMEQMNKELSQIGNCGHGDDGKINKLLATLQLIAPELNMGKHIHMLKNLLNLTKEIIQNSADMYTKQSRGLQDDRKKLQTLQKHNALLEWYVSYLKMELKKKDTGARRMDVKWIRAIQVMKHDDLKRKNETLIKKDQVLQKRYEQLKRKEEQLNSKDEELNRKNEGLERKDEEIRRKVEELKSKEEQLKTKDEEIKERQKELSLANSLIRAAERQTVVYVTKLIDFTNQYRKYLASGNLNFAVAVYGDTEIKDIFRLSESNVVKQMTEQEAYKEGFPCGNDRYIPKCFKCDGTDDCGNWNDERNCSTTTLFPLGARVARGPAWKWGNQDGDPPGVGTVVELATTPFGDWVSVKWDNGGQYEYRIGGRRQIDLRAAAGYFCGAA